ncbi:MAG: hypothetical protein JWQ16_2670 [Novosphingobium sp.]|nr:hypothetical protein [Novosphingobium sp.]
MSEDRTTATNARRGRQSVTWHPLFPAFVAVWFGALFGLGTLAVPVLLIERMVVASGIDRLVSAAAPPLGTNARILIALAMAILGGVIGAVIGHVLARSKPAARARRAAAAAEAHAKAAAEVSDTVSVKPATFDDAPSFIDFSQLNLDDAHRIEASASEVEPVEEFRRPLDPVTFPLPDSFPVPGTAAAQRLNAADLGTLSHLELIERLALSLQKRREEAADADDETQHGDEVAHAEPSDETGPALPALDVPSYYPSAPMPVARHIDAAQDGDNHPVALFPGADAASSAALRQDRTGTERALREALAALQRMSGAA